MLVRAFAINSARRTVIDAAGEFADDYHIRALNDFVLQRRRTQQRLIRAHRAQVGVHAHGLPDAQQPSLRTLLRRRIIEFREAHRSQERRIGFAR